MKKFFFILIFCLSLNNSNAETYSKSEVFELIRTGKFTEKISSRLPGCPNNINVSERINCWGADKNSAIYYCQNHVRFKKGLLAIHIFRLICQKMYFGGFVDK